MPWAIAVTTGAGRDHVEIQGAGAVAVDLGPGSDYLLAGSQLGPLGALGGTGADFLHTTGPAGATLDGGRGADLLTGSLAPDRLTGGDGDDRFSFFGRDPANLRTDVLRCGPGDDTVDTQPVPGADAACPAEIVLPRRARLTDRGIALRVRVAEVVKARFEVFARAELRPDRLHAPRAAHARGRGADAPPPPHRPRRAVARRRRPARGEAPRRAERLVGRHARPAGPPDPAPLISRGGQACAGESSWSARMTSSGLRSSGSNSSGETRLRKTQ